MNIHTAVTIGLVLSALIGCMTGAVFMHNTGFKFGERFRWTSWRTPISKDGPKSLPYPAIIAIATLGGMVCGMLIMFSVTAMAAMNGISFNSAFHI